MRTGRFLLGVLVVLAGLVVSAAAFAVGWQLPLEEDCGGGDACTTTLSVDWDRVQWSVRPSEIACGVPHPDSGTVLMGPGEECVVSGGGQEQVSTYEQLRDALTVRRVVTLVVVAVLAVLALAVGHVLARGRPGGRPVTS